MTTNKVIADSEGVTIRCFVGQLDCAVDFAQFLATNGWNVEISANVKPAEHPRLKEEIEAAEALAEAYDRWNAAMCRIQAYPKRDGDKTPGRA